MFEPREIIKLLDLLIGLTEAQGDEALDTKVEENLKKLIDITNWCLDGVQRASETLGRPEASMHAIGFRAKCALAEWKEWLTEMEEEERWTGGQYTRS